MTIERPIVGRLYSHPSYTNNVRVIHVSNKSVLYQSPDGTEGMAGLKDFSQYFQPATPPQGDLRTEIESLISYVRLERNPDSARRTFIKELCTLIGEETWSSEALYKLFRPVIEDCE
jgi:hypothetical protein